MKFFDLSGVRNRCCNLPSRDRRVDSSDKFSSFEHDHVFIERLQHRVAEAGAAIEKAALAYVQKQEFKQRPSGHAIKEFLLMKAALAAIFAKEGLAQAERLVRCVV